MSIPLDELSAIYNQSIAEDCDKKKEKKSVMLPQGDTPDGGDSAKPGKNKNYVKTMATESKEEVSDHDKEVAKYREQAKKKTTMPKGDVGHDIHKRAVGQYNKQNPSKKVNEGHCEVEGVKCSPVEKKKENKKVKESYSNWRTDLREVVDIADKEEETDSSPETDTKESKPIKEKKIKNKIRINPPQGVTEGFEEIGGIVVEMYEIGEGYTELPKRKMGMKAGKKIISAIGHAGKAGAEGEGTIGDQIRTQKANKKVKQAEKIHSVAQSHNPERSALKSLKNRLTGMAKESADMTGAPSIKDAKPDKKTDVKYDSHMKVMAPSIKKEGLSVSDQMKVSQEYFKKREARSPEEKESEKKKNAVARIKNYAAHKKPNPYKSRVGESD